MIPFEVGKPFLRQQLIDININEKSLSIGLNLIKDYRDKSKIREEACKIRAPIRYNLKVKGDLVWRMCNDARKNMGKFSSNLE